MPREKDAGRFEAIGSDGKTYTIRILGGATRTELLGGPIEWLPGQPKLVTAGGELVNRLGKGQYEVVRTGVTLRSDSPGAP